SINRAECSSGRNRRPSRLPRAPIYGAEAANNKQSANLRRLKRKFFGVPLPAGSAETPLTCGCPQKTNRKSEIKFVRSHMSLLYNVWFDRWNGHPMAGSKIRAD